MGKVLINDTADAVVTRKSDGHKFITAEAQIASLSSSLGINEKIFGGIGNKAISVMRGQKEVTSTLQNALFDLEMLAMTQGVAVKEDGSATVYKKEEGLEVKDGSVTITGTPVGKTINLRNKDGEVEFVNEASGSVTVPEGFAKDGETLSAFYQEDVTGDVLEMKSDKFAEAYEVEYHTIGYDPDTNQVVKDIYIQLDHVIPQGDFELSLENGSALSPSITMDALVAPNTSNIGRVIVAPRTTP